MSDNSTEQKEEATEPAWNLVGARIRHFGPVEECYIPLDSEVTVLYGLNGAGKSHILKALTAGMARDGVLWPPKPEIGQKYEPTQEVSIWIDPSTPEAFAAYDTGGWSPWQALRNGLYDHLTSETPAFGWKSTPESLVLKVFNDNVLPMLKVLEKLAENDGYSPEGVLQSLSEQGEEIEAYREARRDSWMEMSTLALLATLLIMYIETEIVDAPGLLEGSESLTHASIPTFLMESLEATSSKAHLVATTSGGRRTVGLCRNRPEQLLSSVDRDELLETLYPGMLAEEVRAVTASDACFVLMSSDDQSVGQEPSRLDGNPVPEVRVEEIRQRRNELLALVRTDPIFERLLDGFFDDVGHMGKVAWSREQVIDAVLAADRIPFWARDTLFDESDDPGPLPFRILDESGVDEDDLLQTLLRTVRVEQESDFERDIRQIRESSRKFQNAEHMRNTLYFNFHLRSEDWAPFITVTGGTEFNIDSRLAPLAENLTESASHIYQALLPSSQRLICTLENPTQWGNTGPLRWSVLDPSGRQLAIDQLSSAEHRWAQFSIRLANQIGLANGTESIVVFIDEPERALHRRAEAHVASGLKQLAAQHNLRLVIATHSPEFLNLSDANLVHVRRDSENATIATVAPRDLSAQINELGLNKSDLLQMNRGILLVEGQHDLVILDALIGDRLRELGVSMLCMRGAKHLKAWDAQLMQRYTDIPFFVLVDNENDERINDIWERAKEAARAGRSHMRIVDELTLKGAFGVEAEFLRELWKNLLADNLFERCELLAVSLPDIPEYLDAKLIAPSVGDMSWTDLRKAAGGQANTSTKFKAWMKDMYGASYDDDTLRNAALSSQTLHPDFALLLSRIERTVLPAL